MPADPQDRILDAVADNTKVHQQVVRRVDSLERKFEALENTLNQRMEKLETEMGTMNAHLDNLVREAQRTNEYLREESEQRKTETIRRQKQEDEEREYRRKLEIDQRETYKKVGSELWGMFRQPLGYLLAGVVAWLLYTYFAVPMATDAGRDHPPVAEEKAPGE